MWVSIGENIICSKKKLKYFRLQLYTIILLIEKPNIPSKVIDLLKLYKQTLFIFALAL